VSAALRRGAAGLFANPTPVTLQIPTASEALTLQSIGLTTSQTINMLLRSTKQYGPAILPAELHALF